MSELRWYGWGFADKTFAFEHRPKAWNFLRASLDLAGTEKFLACSFNSISLRAPRLTDGQMRALRDLTSPGAVKTDTLTRVTHVYGKSYRDLIRWRTGEIPNPPDAVVYPSTEDQVAGVMGFCANADNGFALIPFGGGTNGVGGVEPCVDRVTLALDLSRLNRVVSVDAVSQTATMEAGILGPDLERELNARGLTLGHFPQSFEFSTLGGWLATRQDQIAELTQSVRVVTPRGVIETRNLPGPSILQLLIGSEGTLGVITQATMRAHALPKTKDYSALLFRNFVNGVEALRALTQNGITPSVAHLLDENATRQFVSLREPLTGGQVLIERIQTFVGYTLERGVLLFLGFEDDANARRGFGICKAHGAFNLGRGIASEWLRGRFAMPYLRDVLLDRGIMLDTVEVATTWENVDRLHKAIGQTIAEVVASTGSKALVLKSISQPHRDGASLSVTFLARMALVQPIEQWETIKRAVTECIVTNGGALPPYQGIGYEHAEWFKRETGAVGMDTLQAIKNLLDPNNVMNPGKWLEAKQTTSDLALEYQERFWNLPVK